MQQEIDATQLKIDEVEKLLQDTKDREDIIYFRKKEEALHKREEGLRKDKEALRNEKNLLLKKSEKKTLGPLRYHPPHPLCGTSGKLWDYQGEEQVVSKISDPLKNHFHHWKKGNKDKQNHALFTVLSAPGTGKVCWFSVE